MCVLYYGKHYRYVLGVVEISASKALWGAGDILCIFKSIAVAINEQALLCIFAWSRKVWMKVCDFCGSQQFYILVDWLSDWVIDCFTANLFPHIPRYGRTAVNEMLSSASCLRGLSLVHESNGDLHSYRKALEVLLSSVRCCSSSVYVLTNASGSYKLVFKNVLLICSIYIFNFLPYICFSCP